jgi:uncharacterized protein (TIGR03083 family)
MSNSLDALHTSVARLRSVVEGLDESQLTSPAYPTEWSIAQVLSHLGSGAVIMKQSVNNGVTNKETPPDFNSSVWEVWNAKAPKEQANDVLVADQTLMATLDGLTDEQRASFRSAIGPMSLDFDGTMRMRLSEHALHLWDVEVVLDPSAVLVPDAVPHLIDNLGMIASFAGKPTGAEQSISVRTSDPVRHITIEIGKESVTLDPASSTVSPNLELPAEALVRLVYGRLDTAHTPLIKNDTELPVLRSTFRGF